MCLVIKLLKLHPHLLGVNELSRYCDVDKHNRAERIGLHSIMWNMNLTESC